MVAARHEISQRLVWLARTPGCGDLCGDRFGHHAETHEVYGAEQARIKDAERTSITTGVLTIDFSAATASVNGRRVQLTARMWQVLEQLALHVGECVRYDDIIRAVWGADWLHTAAAATHNVNITLHRLRSVFGAAAPLLVTRVGVGVVLLSLPPGDMSGVANERQAASQRWARYYDHCRGCGRDDRAHDGHGYCYLCRRRARGGRPL